MKASLILLAAMLIGAGPPTTKAPQSLKPEVVTGSNIPVSPTSLKGKGLDTFIDRMSSCVVRRASSKSDYFLRMSDDFGVSDKISNVVTFLPLFDCLNEASDYQSFESNASFSPRALRNWLSEKEYLDHHASYIDPAPDSELPPPRQYFTHDDHDLALAKAYGSFSDCIVQKDGRDADLLIRTKRGSSEERETARALVPAMSKCLPKGQSLALDQSIIRGLAAQGLWQRFEAPKPIQYKGKN